MVCHNKFGDVWKIGFLDIFFFISSFISVFGDLKSTL